jgi:hypothetical protein
VERAVKRRDFMRWVGAGSAVAAGGSALWTPRRAKAAAFGETPPEYASVMLPAQRRAQSVLEVFMYGGVSPWETFYCSDTYGKANKEWLYTFYDRTVDAMATCGYTPKDELLTPFATDSEGKQVFLGPFLQPLLERPDILARMRIVINKHTLEPHEAAIPLALTGKTLGSPALASLGAHVQQWHVENSPVAPGTPVSYAFATAGGFIPTDNVLSTVATGLHPGSARPLLIKVDNVSRLSELLERGGSGTVDERVKYDALMNAYFDQYQGELAFGGKGEPLRATRYHELRAANASVQGSKAVQDVLDPALFVKLPGSACGTDNTINVPAMSLNLATHLLTHPINPAKHCCVIDTGLKEADGGGGYDTHREMTFTQSRNLNNLLVNLLSKINKPGEADPNKIDLDKTMVLLNQEFGRAPYAQNGGNGRNHWPYGYMQVYIGGPITKDEAGVYGSILETGQASVFTTPTENRIAALLAMGIYPFAPVGYSNSEVQGQGQDAPAIKDVTKRILGISV